MAAWAVGLGSLQYSSQMEQQCRPVMSSNALNRCCISICFIILCLCGCSNMLDRVAKIPVLAGATVEWQTCTVTVNAGARYTLSRTTTLTLNAPDAAEMCFSNDGLTWSSYIPYAASYSWTIGPFSGLNRVHARFRHASGAVIDAFDEIIPVVEVKRIDPLGAVGDFYGGLEPSRNGIPLSLNHDGTVMAIGVPVKTVSGQWARGAVQVRRWTTAGWNDVELTASDGMGGHCFGFSTALSADGSVLVVGALYNRACYVYRWNGTSWEETKIGPYDGLGDEFGVSVDISDDGATIIVGAHKDPAVYVLKWNGVSWVQCKIAAADVAAIGYGISVAVSSDGNTLLVGSRYDNANAGSAYVYRWSGTAWIEKKLVAGDGLSRLYGRCVSLSGDGTLAVVGAYESTVGGNTQQGAVYIYRLVGADWVETKMVQSNGPGSASGDHYGYSVNVSRDGNTMVVGVPLDDAFAGADQGAALVYRWDGLIWNEQFTLLASDGTAGDRFGYCVSQSGDGSLFMVSAPSHNGTIGSLYCY